MRGAEFVNDLCRNYLTIPYEGGEEDFALRMLTENMTEGFLSLELRRMDGKVFLYYDISGMQNMEILYAEKTEGQKEFQNFMWQLHDAIERSRELFLPGDGICLEPSSIYWNLGTRKWEFVYVPGKNGRDERDIQREREQLAEFLVMLADYEDRNLTESVYRFYEEICEGRMYPDFFLERNPDEEEQKCVQEKEQEWEEPEKPAGGGDFREKEEEITATAEQSDQEGFSRRYGGRAGRVSLFLLWLASIALTFFFGRKMREALTLGGVVIVLLTVLLFCTRKKKEAVSEERDIDSEEDVIYTKESIPYEAELTESQENREAEEKTVFMDIGQEQERKLYGIGKFRQLKIFLDRLPCTVGKDKTLVNHIISDSSVSRMHVRFSEEGGSLWMQDLNSTNGTYHNGLRLRPNEKVMLEPEDEVGLGRVQFIYR